MKRIILLIAMVLGCWSHAYAIDSPVQTTLQSAQTSTGNGTAASTAGYASVGVQVVISATATVNFEATVDGSNWLAVSCVLSSDLSTASSATASGLYQCNVSGYNQFRARVSANTGTVDVKSLTTTTALKNGGSGTTGWPTASTTKEITWANSLANAVRIGDGVTPGCFYTDATLGFLGIPCTASNTSTLVLTNFNWMLWDQEGAAAILTADPDAIGAGSGTLTMATGQQLVASNLGVEFAESDTNPTCAAGNYNIYADTSETQLKKCVNGASSLLNGATIVRKTADETVGNSTTKQADDELLFPIATSGTYRFTAYILVQGPAAGDFKFDFSGPAGATGSYTALYFPAAVTACNAANAAQLRSPPLGSEMSSGTEADAVNCPLQVTGVVIAGGTAGNVTFNWAKLAADATNTTVKANSYLIWEKLP